jgi:hypothetical protein
MARLIRNAEGARLAPVHPLPRRSGQSAAALRFSAYSLSVSVGGRTIMTDFIAYHDRTSVRQGNHFDRLFPQGYRIITLSVYGARGDERYGGPIRSGRPPRRRRRKSPP